MIPVVLLRHRRLPPDDCRIVLSVRNFALCKVPARRHYTARFVPQAEGLDRQTRALD